MMHRVLLTLAVLTLPVPAVVLGQSYNDERWQRFIFVHPGRNAIPEDEEIGVLAELRAPDPAWRGGIEVCEAAFSAVEEGRIPADLFYPPAGGPLNHAFGELLSAGGRSAVRRYGLPNRQGKRITVAVRVEGPEGPSTGYVYLVQADDQEWYIEQWAVDLSPLLPEETGGDEPPEEEADQQ